MNRNPERVDYTIYREEIKKCLEILRSGGIILYPTDTIWGIGCNATNEIAVQKIYQVKKREEEKNMIILVDSENMLGRYVKEIPEAALQFIENIDNPLTIIYPDARNLAKNVVGLDGSIGIRITNDAFCSQLINQFRKPIVSSSANISGENAPKSFNDISEEILSTVDYVVNLRQHETAQNKPSTIIKVELNGVFKIIRK
jgi:L-threonylcarbamoyladenylate synthase